MLVSTYIPPNVELETVPVLKALARATRALPVLKGRAATIPNQSILRNIWLRQRCEASETSQREAIRALIQNVALQLVLVRSASLRGSSLLDTGNAASPPPEVPAQSSTQHVSGAAPLANARTRMAPSCKSGIHEHL
jgi:hypothetical protein